ncbi:MAG: thioredoxin family protein [Rikenellaceae bacterium]
MKKITMFIQERCPYCVKALGYIAEVRSEVPELTSIEVEVHDELKEAEFADGFDYYYVPTFYIDGEKVHEGGISRDEVERLLRKAL